MMTLRTRIADDPWDAAAWLELANDMSQRDPTVAANLEEQRAFYDDMLARFPTAARHWKRYAEVEITAGNTQQVKTIFSRCLLSCPSVDLWQTYLTFIQKTNEPRGADGLLEVRKAFEYCLDRVGCAAGAGPLWLQYCALLQRPRAGTTDFAALFGTPPAGQEEAARSAAVRSAYQRAVVVPTASLEALWSAYERFELEGAAKALGRRALDDMRPRHNAAKAAYRLRRKHLEGLDPEQLALPPGKGGFVQDEQLSHWYAYVAWEASNVQRLDQAALAARVVLAYEQALAAVGRHFPDVWLQFALWHSRTAAGGGGKDAALAVLDRGTKVVPDALLLQFAAAEVHEAGGDVPAAKEVYEGLAAPLDGDREAGAPATPDAKDSAAAATAQGQRDGGQQEAGSLVWVQYQRFAKRTEGVRASRQVFLRARKSPAAGWRVYAASARLEWGGDKNEKVPVNIWELGLRHFLQEPDYVLAYAEFLTGIGNMDNARALFERALTAATPAGGPRLWDRFLAFEHEHGSLAAALTIQERRAEALAEASGESAAPAGPPPGDDIRVSLLKYRYEGLPPVVGEGARQHLARMAGEAPPLERPPAPVVDQQAGPSRPPMQPLAAAAVASPPAVAGSGAAPVPPPVRPGPVPAAVQPPPVVVPPPVAVPPPVQPVPALPGGDIKQLPLELSNFLGALPPPRSLAGSQPDVDAVIDILLDVDLSPAGTAAGDAATAAGQPYPRLGGTGSRGAVPPPVTLPPPGAHPRPMSPAVGVAATAPSYGGRGQPAQQHWDAGPRSQDPRGRVYGRQGRPPMKRHAPGGYEPHGPPQHQQGYGGPQDNGVGADQDGYGMRNKQRRV